MIDTTTQTNYILADTRQEVFTRPASPAGQLAVSKDTNSLFVSDGNKWSETNFASTKYIQSTLAGNQIDYRPLHHFDASQTDNLLDDRGQAVSDGDNVSSWLSYGSNEFLHQPNTGRLPVYKSDCLGTGNAGILCHYSAGMIPSYNTQTRDTAVSMYVVYTPNKILLNGLSRESQHYYVPTSDPNYRTSNESPRSGVNYNASKFYNAVPDVGATYNSYIVSNNVGTLYGYADPESLQAYDRYSTTTWTIYGGEGANLTRNLGAENIIGEVTDYPYNAETASGQIADGNDGVGYPNESHHHVNNNYLGKTQILSMRVSSADSLGKLTRNSVLHTFNPNKYGSAGTVASTTTSQSQAAVLYRGLVLNGTISRSTGPLFSGANAFHEVIVFGDYLPQKDHRAVLDYLSNRWTTSTVY